MIADVAFDLPVDHPFSYNASAQPTVVPGQRVWAPLGGGTRIGMVVAVREGPGATLKPLGPPVDPGPVLGPDELDLVCWIAEQSLSSVGASCGGLLPPPPLPGVASARRHPLTTGRPSAPEILVGAGREKRVLERVARAIGPVLVIAPTVETSAQWAQRLARFGPVARLDSGVGERERTSAWRALADGTARGVCGTRSALLAPLVPPAMVVLLEEHEAAHKPPGPPRMHAREILIERARRQALDLVMTASTPSVETWWNAERGRMAAEVAPPGPWPSVTLADTRGILRREPLTPPLARAIRETLGAGRRVFLLVSRLASSLACDECGDVLRCDECRLALVYSRSATTLLCRLCRRAMPLPDLCPACRGTRLSPFGWGAERVEHAVRRRFPDARVARYDPETTRGARAEARRSAASADLVIGTRGTLRLFGPASLGLAGFVSPDQLLRQPDFRAGERTFALLWAAAERVRPDGRVIVQSQNPTHYAFEALVAQNLSTFYRNELKFRAELGYPPFRRLAVVTARGVAGTARQTGAELAAKLSRVGALTVYPAVMDRRERTAMVVVKGGVTETRCFGGGRCPSARSTTNCAP